MFFFFTNLFTSVKEILLEIGFGLIKKSTKPCSMIPLIYENGFNPFDSSAFRNFVTSEKDDLAKFLLNKDRNYRLLLAE